MSRDVSGVGMFPMVVFLQVCLLELRDSILHMIDIPLGKILEIFLDPHSRLISHFLLDGPMLEQGTHTL